MASGMADFLRNESLDNNLKALSYTGPASVYAHLYTTTLTSAVSGTEVTGGAYAATLVTFGTVASSGSISSTADCTFPTATASWGTVTDAALEDAAATSANALYWGALAASKTVANGDTFKFNSGDITVTHA